MIIVIKYPNREFNRTYRFESIVIQNQEKIYSDEKSFTRKVEIHFLGHHKGQFLYQLLTTDFDFSNEDNSEGIFLKKIGRLFSEVQILADKENSILRIVNLKELRVKWKNLSEKLSVDYKGHTVENYFKTIEKILDDEAELISFFEEYRMFGMYFNGHYGDYNFNKRKQRIIILDQISITDQMWVNEDHSGITVQHVGKLENNIVSSGTFNYKKNVLNEGFIEVNTFDKQTKHSLLWIG